MDKTELIQQLDDEIKRLKQARDVLAGGESGRIRVGGRGPRQMSAAARARISAAQKARWAKVKGKRTGTTKTSVSKSSPRRMSTEGRARIAAAQRKRWAKVKAGKKK